MQQQQQKGENNGHKVTIWMNGGLMQQNDGIKRRGGKRGRGGQEIESNFGIWAMAKTETDERCDNQKVITQIAIAKNTPKRNWFRSENSNGWGIRPKIIQWTQRHSSSPNTSNAFANLEFFSRDCYEDYFPFSHHVFPFPSSLLFPLSLPPSFPFSLLFPLSLPPSFLSLPPFSPLFPLSLPPSFPSLPFFVHLVPFLFPPCHCPLFRWSSSAAAHSLSTNPMIPMPPFSGAILSQSARLQSFSPPPAGQFFDEIPFRVPPKTTILIIKPSPSSLTIFSFISFSNSPNFCLQRL